MASEWNAGIDRMRTNKFSEEQIVYALRQAEASTRVIDICRKMEITETTFHR